MLRKILLVKLVILSWFISIAQCDSVQVVGDLIVSSDVLMSGTYVVEGTFRLESNTTIYVTPYTNNGCGELKIYAQNIDVQGTVNGNYAGFSGGEGGEYALAINSVTGDENALIGCSNTDNDGHVSIEGGKAGMNGEGPGAGIAGDNGTNGSGPKQNCGNSGDDAGLIGGSGGAGGGSGGSYGGTGQPGQKGGDGSSQAAVVDFSFSGAYPTIAGIGGDGGAMSAIYGTNLNRDIQIGSGGAGAGGGGRSHYTGTSGARGGSGGGMVYLFAEEDLSITGIISVNGEDGSFGGNGGSGDEGEDCCSDGCNDCGEKTFSAGAGAGSGSGAGSGGGIFIEAYGNINITGTLSANGGSGGQTGSAGTGTTCLYDGGVFCGSGSITTGDGNVGSFGGSGGGGRIKIFAGFCDNIVNNAIIHVSGGSGNEISGEGSIEEVCGYLHTEEQQLSSLVWSVYPNPSNGLITVDINNFYNQFDVELRVINTSGQTISHQFIQQSSTQIDLSQVQNGMYLIQIVYNDQIEFKRLIKH